MKRIQLLTAEDLKRTYLRLAHQIIEPYDDNKSPAIIGMQTRGVHMAKRLLSIMQEEYNASIEFGVLDVTFYRDDFRTSLKMPEVKVTDIPFDLYGKDVVLVDDVLYTGRTLRSAMDAVMDFGRPHQISFCCMVDRGHRELPIQPDYTGLYVPTHVNEEVRVRVEELDDEDAVYLLTDEEKTENEQKAGQ